MTSALNIDALIRKGYFPDVLPPQFTTSKLADILPENNEDICKLKNQSPYKSKFKSSKCCLHSVPKLKIQRRLISIPNPFHQILLCRCLTDHWNDIESFFTGSQISLSKPIIDPQGKRSIKRNIGFRDKIISGILKSSDGRYCLITDISRFYPTIYTHSIPWALHGKAEAKKNQKCKNKFYGNCIDQCVRNTQDQQTLGIPVGPDSSHILSEIIGTDIDSQLCTALKEKLNIDLKGFRCVDDMCLFFKDRSSAEQALHELHGILHYYELEVNPTKTEIIELPQPLQKEWPAEVRLYQFRVNHTGPINPIMQETDLVDYFSKAFEKAIRYPNDSILKYSLKRIQDQEIHPDNWDLYESLILKSIVAEPMCIPVALSILYSAPEQGYILNKNKVSATISEMLRYHSKFSHGYELAWTLWLAIVLNVRINADVAKMLSKCDDVVVALTVLDLQNRDLIEGKLDTSVWRGFMNGDGLYSDHWLLAYEAYIKGWLPHSTYVEEDPFFKILYDNAVEFYDCGPDMEQYIDCIKRGDSEY